MVFCFDIDGTISAKPIVFKEIMRSLMRCGHEVYPLTAMREYEGSPYEDIRINQLASFDLHKGIDFTDVVVCVSSTLDGCGSLKGKFCSDMKAVMMVEDTDLYINEIKKVSDGTLCLRMA